MNKTLIVRIASIILAVLIVGGLFIAELRRETSAGEISAEDAQTLLNDTFDAMAKNDVTKAVAEVNYITVNEVSYGDERDIILDCTIETKDMYSAIEPLCDEFLSSDVKKKNSTMFKSALDFKLEFNEPIKALTESADEITTDTEIFLYDTENGLTLYASDEAVDAVYGGLITLKNEINAKNTYKITDENGETVEKEIETKNVTRGLVECISPVYDSQKPDTSGKLMVFVNDLKADFKLNFLDHSRWKSIFKGLGVTLELTSISLLIGVALGFIVALIRCTYLKKKKHGIFLRLFNAVCQIYLTVTRGTPVVVQILIIHFVILMPMGVSSFVSAFLCFGLNSGAYVAEIVRGGIMSVDDGQMEAGRSLGFNYVQTMWYIIFPQAFKAVLPALANEFVSLLKETSIAFYIGLGDLMYSVNAIRAATYSPFMPLIASAVIYLILVLFFSKLISILERKLRNSER